MKRSGRGPFFTALIVTLAAIMALSGAYIIDWHRARRRIEAAGESQRALYSMAVSAEETADDNPRFAGIDAAEAEGGARAAGIADDPLSGRATASSGRVHYRKTSAAVSPRPTPDAPQSTEPPAPTPSQAPSLQATEPMPVPFDEPAASAQVYQLPTAPPVQSRFDGLLEANPDTVAFLTLDEELAFPVVQRRNDNDFYLTHNFDGEQAIEGALFLDGSNLLVPEDDCLIVYGHNMKNGTMFGALHRFAMLSYLRQHALVQFDTLYENRSYVPFAVFAADVSPESDDFFEVRRFLLDSDGYVGFVRDLRARSLLDIPVDAVPGDRLLLLVTCDYSADNGRFIVALRQRRAAETEPQIRAAVEASAAKP